MKCRICGSGRLHPDPAGYYADARDGAGAPYMCVDYKRHELATGEKRV